MFYKLPPVFHPVIHDLDCEGGLPVGPTRKIHTEYYDSGTSALAAVFVAIRASQAQSDHTEVIMAGYTCPDVISAALYAGLRPVLVDFIPNRPWLDLDEVRTAITNKTVAILAINFLGIPERMRELRSLVDDFDLFLVEDSAQAFSPSEQPEMLADARIHSFGRGKPVNILGGGIAIIANPKLVEKIPHREICPPSRNECAQFKLKAFIFNLITHPRVYWFIEKIPLLHIGETRFHPLADLRCMPNTQWLAMKQNVDSYGALVNVRAELSQAYTHALTGIDGLELLPDKCRASTPPILLRYPLLLINKESRNAILTKLESHGYGGSALYEHILPEILDVPLSAITVKSKLRNARSFSERLLTLPVHNRALKIKEKIIKDMCSWLTP